MTEAGRVGVAGQLPPRPALRVAEQRRGRLEDTIGTFRRWLHLPDELALLALLGAIAANLFDGDPVWLLLVGPPSGGKSELLQSVTGLANVLPAATLTEAALLSGTPAREKAKDAKGGLLRRIGDGPGIIVCKDFGSVLSMHHTTRSEVMAALREVYDGSWTRHVGTDGGRMLHWQGKVGLVAGATEAIDRYHSVMSAMGERFVTVRLPALSPDDRREQASRAIEHRGMERTMRAELRDAVVSLFEAGDFAEPAPLDPDEKVKLQELSMLVTSCRSSVERDSYTREVEMVPEAEAPGRLAAQLVRMHAALQALGVPWGQSWHVVTMAGLGSIPSLRLRVLDTLYTYEAHEGRALTTSEVGEHVRHPTGTARRALEDLTGHNVAVRSDGLGSEHCWGLTGWARELLDRLSAPA